MIHEYNPGLNPMNAIINEALKTAMSAVHHLNDQGATVFGVEIRGGRPIVQIDGQHGAFLRGAMKSRKRQRDGTMKVVLVASVNGCQIEWNERHETAREALPA